MALDVQFAHHGTVYASRCDREIDRPAVAVDQQEDRVMLAELRDRLVVILYVPDRCLVYFLDHVARLQQPLSGTLLAHIGDNDTVQVRREIQLVLDTWREFLDRD